MPKKQNKILNISIMFTDKHQIAKAFDKILFHVKKGEQEKSDSWSWEKQFIYYEFNQSFSVNYDYKESHINGNVCHVYKSKI